ncbi:MAG TPA: ABC transporter permease [Bryobacteraceae bacterium]|nr:ABC transporter permease [Bryobacteraceae bacterium]
MRDLRYALRMLLHRKAFTTAAVLCLALGIGATTAIFSVVNAVVLRPLPYRDPQKLLRVYTEFPTFPNGGLLRFWTSPPEFLELRRDTKSWDSLEAWSNGGTNLGGGQEPVRLQASFVSGGLLPMLGVPPLKGSLLTPQDDAPQAAQTAVLAYGAWQRIFGGDPNIMSREVKLNGRACTIVGIMPDGFQFPPGEIDPPELWTPLQINPASPGGRGSHFLYLLGRVKDSVSAQQARQELDQLVRASEEKASPNTHVFRPKTHPLVSYSLHEEVVGNVKPAMLAMLAAVVFVLLIACGNVANLLLARAEGRQREISIRTAMGADSHALLRQFLTEGVLLSLLGALLGFALAFGGLRLIVNFNAGSIPRATEISMDWRVLVFTLGVSITTGVFFGLAPLLHRFGKTVAESMKAAGGRTTASIEAIHFRRAMIAGELALALVLLIGSGLMIRAFWKLEAVDIGMRTDRVLTMRLALPQTVYQENRRVVQFWHQLLQRVNDLPGVEAATVLSGTPPIRPLNANDTQIEGLVPQQDGPRNNIDYYQTTGDKFLEATGARLIEGRMYGERDGENAPAVVVVNQTMARIYYPGQSAIGKRIRPNSRDPWCTIVGVIGDVKNAGIDKPTGTEIFLPFRQAQGSGIRGGTLFVRSKGEPRDLYRAIRTEIADIDPNLPVAQVRSFEDIVGVANARPRFLTILLSLFSAVALLLAAIGIYGVMSYLVAQRTSEFGIRMAIGAQRRQVLWLVIRQGMMLGLVGVLAGAVGALGLTRFLKGLLYGVDTLDPLTFAAMASALTVVVLLACFLPALRATKVDPMTALRYE